MKTIAITLLGAIIATPTWGYNLPESGSRPSPTFLLPEDLLPEEVKVDEPDPLDSLDQVMQRVSQLNSLERMQQSIDELSNQIRAIRNSLDRR